MRWWPRRVAWAFRSATEEIRMQPGSTPHPFWNFSLEVYGGEGVARACLELQDRRGVDVNLL